LLDADELRQFERLSVVKAGAPRARGGLEQLAEQACEQVAAFGVNYVTAVTSASPLDLLFGPQTGAKSWL
jgi:hypothetical protein